MTTDRDYADMVNPYVRAEEEAHQRGYREGVAAGAFYATLIFVMLVLALAGCPAKAADWSFEEASRPIKASERGARITVCQNNATGRTWACFSVR